MLTIAYFVGMEVIWGLGSFNESIKDSSLTVGNYDGLHLGHQAIIRDVVAKGKEKGIPSILVTFDPHPMTVLQPQRGVLRIDSVDEKISQLESLGLDYLVVEPFSRELSQLEPEAFFNKLLVKKLGVKFLFVGYDFSFGKNRSGTLDVLSSICKRGNVELKIIDAFKVEGQVVSSSLIRQLIQNGDVKDVAKFLGRPFSLRGLVKKGEGRGKKIGVPTANLETQSELWPAIGVYVTEVDWQGKTLRSVTNVGRNPTFVQDGKAIHIETHILDFDKDIYGENLTVRFKKLIRGEKKFSSVQELVSQIKSDIETARNFNEG